MKMKNRNKKYLLIALAAVIAALVFPSGAVLPAALQDTDAPAAYAEETEPGEPQAGEPEQTDISGCQITLSGKLIYTGSKIVPGILVELDGNELIPDTDYTYSLKNNKNAGEASLTITGIGLYCGEVSTAFTIAPAPIKSAGSLKTATYTGERIRQYPVVKALGKELTEGRDYTLTFKNNKRVGRASAVIKGTGNYTGTLTRHFKIRPRGTAIKGTDETKKRFTVKWKRQRAQTDGYQIRYCARKSFDSGVRNRKVGDTSLSSVTLKKPANASKVYIRIRTYKKVDGQNYYSVWSKVKATDGFITAPKNLRAAAKVKQAVIFNRPSVKGTHLMTLPFGAKVTVRKQKGGWSYVRYSAGGTALFGYMRAPHIVKYNKTKRHLALTFDDGPRAGTTDTVLNALSRYGFRATFFVVGNGINANTRSLILRQKKLGCEIGNHSWSHPQLTDLSSAGIASQLSSTDNAVKDITGKKPALCRAPYGAVNDTVLSVMNRPNILWSVDTLDWKYRDTDRLIGYVRDNKRDGAVILMHDIHPTTAAAVNSICSNLYNTGYEAVTVTELAAIKGYNLSGTGSFRSFY